MHHDYLIPMNQTFNITSELPLVTCNLYIIYICVYGLLYIHTPTQTHIRTHTYKHSTFTTILRRSKTHSYTAHKPWASTRLNVGEVPVSSTSTSCTGCAHLRPRRSVSSPPVPTDTHTTRSFSSNSRRGLHFVNVPDWLNSWKTSRI